MTAPLMTTPLMMTPAPPTLTPAQFIARWQDAGFGERQGAQSFFNDLCALVGHPAPAAYGDPEVFTFEKAVPGGFADAYFEEHFGWEFKGRDAQLEGAFDQLLRYQVHLKTPPLLVVSSFDTIRIQTNFQNMETARYEIPVAGLEQPDRMQLLRDAFFAPGRFRERLRSVDEVTRATAALFQAIVEYMEQGNTAGAPPDPERLARYLNQLVFCLYAEDAGLLPEGLFTRIVAQNYREPSSFDGAVRSLFAQMAAGGFAGADPIARFNGDLFQAGDTVPLNTAALQKLGEACASNWRNIEPSIFGTLFERALDAAKRTLLGAHYTGAEDIMLVVEPVVMQPLRREWDAARREIDDLRADDDHSGAYARLEDFRRRLASVTVLDPACGSGNFLYIAMRSLLDLEKQVIDYNDAQAWPEMRPAVNPGQMLGLEINPYAAELARTALWIGYIQWHQTNGIPYRQSPILTPTNNSIRLTDAILANGDTEIPAETQWPEAEFIIGNPPFLGSLAFRRELGDEYANAVYALYGSRIPNSSDYCCYWFEKARAQIENGNARRAGLLATQAIRFQNNRRALARIKETGDIFAAISDRDWILDGASVHIAIICFDNGSETTRTLNHEPVDAIHSNLTSNGDITQARPLAENANICFTGAGKNGPFEITRSVAENMLRQPNPDGKPNSDVIKPWLIGHDINQVSRDMWIIDFGVDLPEAEAALYEAPFEYVVANVKPERINNRMRRRAERWWLHGSTALQMRQAISGLSRYIATSQVSKHRLFSYVDGGILPDATLVVFARDDDYFFGILQSRIHEIWARAMGTQRRNAESGIRYIISACFDTFPFPQPDDAQRAAVASAAARLNQLRHGWLNPADAHNLKPAELRRRTLTNLYNACPTWLNNAHQSLDHAVAAAYNWPPNLDNNAILDRLLTLNLQRSEQ